MEVSNGLITGMVATVVYQRYACSQGHGLHYSKLSTDSQWGAIVI